MLDKIKEIKEFKIDGRIVSAKINYHAHYADSSILLRESNNTVLAALVIQPLENPFQTANFTVDYRERMYAGNRIPGNYFRRELKPSEREVLIAKSIERCLRSALPNLTGYRSILYVNVLSASPNGDLPSLSLLASSIALNLSSLPLSYSPLAVRVSKVSDFTLFLPFNREEDPPLDLFVSFDGDTVLAIDGKTTKLSPTQILSAVQFARQQLQPIAEFIRKSSPKRTNSPQIPAEILKSVSDKFSDKIIEILKNSLPSPERQKMLRELKRETKLLFSPSYQFTEPTEHHTQDPKSNLADESNREDSLAQEEPVLLGEFADNSTAEQAFQYLYRTAVRTEIFDGNRLDGRDIKQPRTIELSTGLLPSSDGSALCERGETQILATVTIGSQRDAQNYETIFGTVSNRYLFHHNSPPMAFGNINSSWAPGFRELDLGHFIRKALLSALPPIEKKTIRGVSELLSSAGALSTTAITAVSMALLEAGVPLKHMTVGVTLAALKTEDNSSDNDKKLVFLADPLSEEEFASDAVGHFAGNSEGFTAIQYYTLNTGLSSKELEEFLSYAQKALSDTYEKLRPTAEPLLEKNLDEKNKFEPNGESRTEKNYQNRESRQPRYHREEGTHQPRQPQRTSQRTDKKIPELKIEVDPSLVGKIIGFRGQHVQALRQLFNVQINADKSGEITVTGHSPEDVARTTRQLKALIEPLEQNKPYLAAVIESSESHISVRVGEHEGIIPKEEMTPDEKRPFRGQELLVIPTGIDREGHLLFSAKKARNLSPQKAVNYEEIEL